jgi:hypothetical protein
MVSSVSSSSSYQYQPQTDSTVKMTDEEKTTLSSILSKYDSSSMSGEDMKSMMDEIKEAGIKPSDDMKDIMDAAGFKPPEKPQDSTSTSSTTATSSTQSALQQQLSDLLASQQSGELTQDDINSFIAALKNSTGSSVGTLVNQTA